MSGLFGTFEIAKRGLSATQSKLNTTSHNIANIDTAGYTRQRSVATTTTPYGGNSKFDSCTVGQVGTGVQISSIERIRDSFQDYAVRNETTINSSLNIQDKHLEAVDDIFTNTDETGLGTALSDFYSKFSTLGSATSTPTTAAKTTAIASAATLATTIRTKDTALETEKTTLQDVSKANVTTINEYLGEITTLNKSIATVTSNGSTPNDLMDSRDLLLDELSAKFGITVSSEDNNAINVSITGTDTKLVDSKDIDGTNCTRFSSIESVAYGKKTDPTDSTKQIDDTSTLIVTYNKLGDETNTGTITLTGLTDGEKLKTSLEESGILVADSDGTVNVTASALTEASGASTNELLTPIISGTTSTITDSAGNTTVTDTSLNTITKTDISSGITTVITTDASAGTTTSKTTNTPLTTTTTRVTNTSGETTIKTVSGATTTTTNVAGETTTTTTDETSVKAAMFKPSGGEVGGNQITQEKIQEYMDKLDKFAVALAYTVNAIQTGSTDVDKDGSNTNLTNHDLIFVNSAATTTTDTGISAKTIKINSAIDNDATKLNCGETSDSGVASATRALAIKNITSLEMDFTKIDTTSSTTRAAFFDSSDASTYSGVSFEDTSTNQNLVSSSTGSTLADYYTTLVGKIASDGKTADSALTTSTNQLTSATNNRTSTSGVSEDEETTNLIAYQHAYEANSKIISVIDKLLDVVINGLMA
jgi:flagellar hook-associated protein 1 FlgK